MSIEKDEWNRIMLIISDRETHWIGNTTAASIDKSWNAAEVGLCTTGGMVSKTNKFNKNT